MLRGLKGKIVDGEIIMYSGWEFSFPRETWDRNQTGTLSASCVFFAL